MKVLLYFESIDKIKNSGIGRALRHQIQSLEYAGIEYTLDPDDTYDIAHVNTYFLSSKRLVKKLKRRHVPVIVHGHTTKEDFRESFKGWKIAKIWFYPNLMWFYKTADLIITPTPYSKSVIEAYKKGVEVKCVSNGINMPEYTYHKENEEAYKKFFDIKDGEKVIMGAGFYFKRKGIHDFIEVARHFPKVKFIWFGFLKKWQRTSFVKKVMKNKPDNVYFPGYVPDAVIRGAYHSANAFFFPTYEENEGIVVLEALASERPIILRDIGVYKDWMQDGVNCYKAKNNEEFIQKIEYVLNNDNSTIIKNGLKTAQERTLDKVGLELKKVYEDLLENYKK